MELSNTYKIFLLDAIGALVSIALLFLLYHFEHFFGMPKIEIAIFLCIATALFLYSTTIYIIKPKQWRLYLKIIAVLNISYCILTIIRVLQNLDNLSIYGILYFIGEILVIFALSAYEFSMARKQ